jgi:hypothetical protein
MSNTYCDICGEITEPTKYEGLHLCLECLHTLLPEVARQEEDDYETPEEIERWVASRTVDRDVVIWCVA